MNIKQFFNPANRGRIYTVVTAIVAALVVFGVISASLAPLVIGLAVSIVTLVMAIMYSKSQVRTAIYGVCAATGAVMIALGIMDGTQVDALIGIAAPLLGITLAAAKTPAEYIPKTV